MSRGIAVSARHGKKDQRVLYIQLKGGSVYRHPTLMSEAKMAQVCKTIAERDFMVELKHWKKVNRKVPV